jgi:Bacterial conjugation TrbI-like protein
MTQITTPEEPTRTSPETETKAKPYLPPARKSHVPAGADKLIIIGIALLVVVFAVVFTSSHKMTPTKAHGRTSRRSSTEQRTSATADVMPADENNAPSASAEDDPDSITANDIIATKNSLEAQKRHAKDAAGDASGAPGGTKSATHGIQAGTSKQTHDQSKTLGSIPPFQPPPYNGAAAAGQPYGGSVVGSQYPTAASSSELMRAWNEEVTKPRIVFSRKSVPAAADATRYLGPPITNFGLEPGFHIAARLEASATTSVAVPVTAVIEYNYERDGRIVLPAGSRAIGHINGADDHGNMAISFESIELPDGASVPISAVAVDTNLRTLKGRVTGSSRGKAMLVATLSGIGQTTAMMLGNNTNAALSGQDMMRSQLSQNMGNTADTQIAKMISNEKIVVTLAAGTEIYMVFTKPALPQNSAQKSLSPSGPGRTAPIS